MRSSRYLRAPVLRQLVASHSVPATRRPRAAPERSHQIDSSERFEGSNKTPAPAPGGSLVTFSMDDDF